MTFKIIHHFVSEDGVLREIKWLDNKEDILEDGIWQWSPFGYEPIQLHYKTGQLGTRHFEEGSLTFDHLGCTFTYYTTVYRLNRLK